MTDENNNKKHKKILEKFSGNYWVVSTFVLAILLLAVVIYGSFLGDSSIITANIAGQKVADWVSEQVDGVEVLEITDEGGLYAVTFSYTNPETSQPNEATLQITKDGTNLILQAIPLTGKVTQDTPTKTTQTSTSVPKSNKPVLELFVMTHCPYGTQAEKGFIPFMESIGDKVDSTIRFVHYFMHEPEQTETPRQVCIREEQPDRFIPYLKKFLEGGSYQDAVLSSGVDEDAMNECIESGRWEEYYMEDSALSQSYGVGGSPTLVVNGIIAQSGRSPASYLSTACSSFNESPEECNQELSVATPTPMWGWDSSGATSEAQC